MSKNDDNKYDKADRLLNKSYETKLTSKEEQQISMLRGASKVFYDYLCKEHQEEIMRIFKVLNPDGKGDAKIYHVILLEIERSLYDRISTRKAQEMHKRMDEVI